MAATGILGCGTSSLSRTEFRRVRLAGRGECCDSRPRGCCSCGHDGVLCREQNGCEVDQLPSSSAFFLLLLSPHSARRQSTRTLVATPTLSYLHDYTAFKWRSSQHSTLWLLSPSSPSSRRPLSRPTLSQRALMPTTASQRARSTQRLRAGRRRPSPRRSAPTAPAPV